MASADSRPAIPSSHRWVHRACGAYEVLVALPQIRGTVRAKLSTWFHKTIVCLLLAVWLPATLHCDLESIEGFAFLACGQAADAAPHQETDCDQDACAVVESGFYHAEHQTVRVIPPALVPSVPGLLAAEPTALLAATAVSPPVAGPPELSRRWQFSHRTALPPRAPSLLA